MPSRSLDMTYGPKIMTTIPIFQLAPYFLEIEEKKTEARITMKMRPYMPQ